MDFLLDQVTMKKKSEDRKRFFIDFSIPHAIMGNLKLLELH